ncbi:MAG: hypothetical protein M9951_10215 [Burkholderiaceae bacterium]|nr:hypothetical protein [Burkholderiaceae bacterium]
MIRPTARPRVIAAFAALLLMAACAGPQVDARPQSGERVYSTTDVLAPMSIGDIVLQLESNRPEGDIVAELFDRGLAAPASPGDLTLLRRAGASPELLQAVYEAPLARSDGAGNVVIIREPAFVPYVIDPWPHYYPGYRYRPLPPRIHPPHPPPHRVHPPHRPPPHQVHPRPGRPGPGVDRPQRPPITGPTPPRQPAPNRYSPRPQPTPGMSPPVVNRPAAKPTAPAPRPGGQAPTRPTR